MIRGCIRAIRETPLLRPLLVGSSGNKSMLSNVILHGPTVKKMTPDHEQVQRPVALTSITVHGGCQSRDGKVLLLKISKFVNS